MGMLSRFLNHRRRAALERQLEDEFRAHIEMRTQDNIASGMTASDARADAQRRFGHTEVLKEKSRDANLLGWLDELGQDLRFAMRMIRRWPVFTAVAVLSLALGIGANVGIFSLMDAVLFRPLPVEKPSELMKFASAYSYPMYRELRDGNTVFSGLLARQISPVNILTSGQPQRSSVELVSGNYFAVLGVPMMLGRQITPEDDDAPMRHPVAVLSYVFWRDRFGSDPQAIGKTLRINNFPFTIIGVAPASFTGVQAGSAPDLWAPLMAQPQLMPDDSPVFENTGNAWLELVGRRRPGISEKQAVSGINVLFKQITADGHHKLYRGKIPGREALYLSSGAAGFSRLAEPYANPLYILMVVVTLVLLIACVNIANLLLARSAARQKEIAVRLAIGAGKFRLVRQLLTESMLLALLGGALGLVFSRWSVALLLGFLPATTTVGIMMVPLSINVQMNARVLGFALVVSILTGILFGLAPALQAVRAGVSAALKEEGVSVPVGGLRLNLARILVVSQVGLSMLLLVAAGLFLRSLRNMTQFNTGMNVDNVVQASINPALNGYPPDQTANFYRQLMARLQANPGVKSVTMTAYPFLAGTANGAGLIVPGRPYPADYHDVGIRMNFIDANFFDTLETRLLAGRNFLPTDSKESPVIIITEAAARHFFPGENAIGRKVRFGGHNNVEIVGIAADIKYDSLRDQLPRTAYVSIDESPWPVDERTIYARIEGDPRVFISVLRREVQQLDSSLPLFGVKTFQQQKEESLSPNRLLATLSGFFGMLALFLASIGLYGVMAAGVQRRTREIGIRMSLGARRTTVLWMVLRSCLWMVAAGIIVGVAVSMAAVKLVASLLFGIPARDPISLAGAAMVLFAVAALAGFIPARRASQVDPIVALRYE